MAISLVFSGQTATSATSGTSFVTGVITGSSLQNDLMIVAINTQVATVTSVGDNFGNTYTAAVTNYNYQGTNYLNIYYCYQSTHWGSNPSFTVGLSQSNWGLSLNAYDFNGTSATPLETSANASGTLAATINGPAVTNNFVPDLLFSAVAATTSTTLSAATWGNLVSNNTTNANNPLFTSALIKTAGGGTNTPSYTSSTTSGFNYGATSLVFTGSGAVASTTKVPLQMLMGLGT